MPPGVQTELIQSFQRLDGFDHRITGRAQTQYDWLLEAFLRQSHRRDEEGCALDTFPCSAPNAALWPCETRINGPE